MPKQAHDAKGNQVLEQGACYVRTSPQIDVFPVEGVFSRADILADAVEPAVNAARDLFRQFSKDFTTEFLRDWLVKMLKS